MYYSGWQASKPERELRVIKSGHLKYRCLTFAHMRKIPGFPYYLSHYQGVHDLLVKHKVGIFMDSGVVGYRSHKATLIRNGGKGLEKLVDEQTYIQMYVDFCKELSKHWDFYMTIDLERDAPSIFKRHCVIEKMGIRPVPVFHGDATVDFLKKYADMGHKLIGIASAKSIRSQQVNLRRYFDAVFNAGAKYGLQMHGLAMTAPWLLVEYPWFSVDSSSWSRVAGYGGIMLFNAVSHRMSVQHISHRHSTGKGSLAKLNPVIMDRVKEQVQSEGFDFEQLREDFVERHIYNAYSMNRLIKAAARKHGTWEPLI